MPSPLPVLINRSSGAAAELGDALADTVTAAFGALEGGAGRTIALELLDPEEFPAAIERHRGAPVIAIGGGDSTVGAAAAVLANSLSALAILPLGTRNHLARRLGVPLALAEAAGVAVRGRRRRIDLGLAGTRAFVNNASFGIYTRFVSEPRSAGPHWTATLRAAWHRLAQMGSQYFLLRIDGALSAMTTPLLFIGNTGDSPRRAGFGQHESVTEHRLSLFALAATGPMDMLGLALRTLVGLTKPTPDLLEYGAAREIVIGGHGAIEGRLDGEEVALGLPLRLCILPNALGVVTPQESAEPERALIRIH